MTYISLVLADVTISDAGLMLDRGLSLHCLLPLFIMGQLMAARLFQKKMVMRSELLQFILYE